MRRAQLEHVLRAASTIVGERDVLVIGSQAILGAIPDEDLPLEATTSIEADLAFLREDLVDADTLLERIDLLSVSREQKARLGAWVDEHRRTQGRAPAD